VWHAFLVSPEKGYTLSDDSETDEGDDEDMRAAEDDDEVALLVTGSRPFMPLPSYPRPDQLCCIHTSNTTSYSATAHPCAHCVPLYPSGQTSGAAPVSAPMPVSHAALLDAASEKSKLLEAAAQILAKEVIECAAWDDVWCTNVMSTRRDPHPCRPVTTPDPSDSASTPVPVVSHPTPPNATKIEPSSTAYLPSAPHSSPCESFNYRISPRHVRGQHFPAIRPPEQSTPTPAKPGFRESPHLHLDRVPLPLPPCCAICLGPYAHALAAAAVARTVSLLRKGRVGLSSRQSKRSTHLPVPP
jgi:hypothetical protein